MLDIASDLSLPIATVTEKLAILGRTGSGKTYCATKLAELMLEKDAQIVVLDPVGVWYGLRVGGKWDIYIFGGLNQDLPLEPSKGAFIADLIIDRGISAVLDISQFESHSDQIRFTADFAERFYFRRKSNPSAVHVFLEEAQEFVPQTLPVRDPNGSRMLHSFSRLWKLGRNYGIGGTLISQRPQAINKEVLNQAGTLFVFSMTGPQERDAIDRWVSEQGIKDSLGDLLPKLKRGQPHVWSPTFLEISKTVKILPKITADVSITPLVGTAAKKQALTPIDVKAIAAALTATADKEADDDPAPFDVDYSGEYARLNTEIDRLKDTNQRLMIENERFMDALTDIHSWAEDIHKRSAPVSAAGVPVMDYQIHESNFRESLSSEPETIPPVRETKPVKREKKRAESGTLTQAERKLLAVLASYPNGKPTTPFAIMAGYTVNGHFNNMLGGLRSRGYIAPGQPVRITEEGRQALGKHETPMRRERLQEFWLGRLSQSEGKLLRNLIQAFPRTLTTQQLAQASGYTVNGHFNNMLGKLRRMELAVGHGQIKASGVLFE